MKKLLLLFTLLPLLLCGCGEQESAPLADQIQTRLDYSGQTDIDIIALSQQENLQLLDLRQTDITLRDYEFLYHSLPGCEILWEIPFQGNYYSMDTTSVSFSQLSSRDWEHLSWFSQLEHIDATACQDFNTIAALLEQYPDCTIDYAIALQMQTCSADTSCLTLNNAIGLPLKDILSCMPSLQRITLTGMLPDGELLQQLMEQYPQVTFSWEYTLLGHSFPNTLREMDLSGIPIETTLQLEKALAYFPQLEKVILVDCGLSDETMAQLNVRHPEVLFVWEVEFGGGTVRTDIESFIPLKQDLHVDDDDIARLQYLTQLVCLDLGYMPITDCSFLYAMPKLQYLLLPGTNLQDITPIGSLKELKYLELFLTPVSDLTPLQGCDHLEDLNISCTKPQDLTVLSQVPQLKNLWINGMEVHDEDIQLLEQAHPSLVISCIPDGYAIGNGWRSLPGYFAQRDLLGMPYAE